MKKILVILLLVSSIIFSNVFVSAKNSSDKYITRSEFVVMLDKALDITIMYFKAPDVTDYFNDVSNKDAFASSLIDLVTARIIDYKGSFRPNGTIPRDEYVHYIMNAYRYKSNSGSIIKNGTAVRFADKARISTSYLNDVAQAVGLGLVKGSGKNLFRPKDKITAAEATVLVDRLKGLLGKKAAEVAVTPGYEFAEDGLVVTLRVINNTGSAVTINHSSGQKYDFALLDSGRKVIYRWSADKMFDMALGTTVINPGKWIEFSEKISFESYKDVIDKTVYLKAFITGESKNFPINADGYEVKLLK